MATITDDGTFNRTPVRVPMVSLPGDQEPKEGPLTVEQKDLLDRLIEHRIWFRWGHGEEGMTLAEHAELIMDSERYMRNSYMALDSAGRLHLCRGYYNCLSCYGD